MQAHCLFSVKPLSHPRVILWALRKIGIDEWLVRLIQSIYENARSSVCWLQPEWRVQCESGRSPKLLLEPVTVHHGSGSPVPGYSYRMPLGKPVCRWPGHHHWIAVWITIEIDPLLDQQGRKGNSGQHGQNQRLDIWAGDRSASEVWQRPLWRESQVRRHKLSVVVVSIEPTRNAVASLAVWSLMPASGVNGALDRPDQ